MPSAETIAAFAGAAAAGVALVQLAISRDEANKRAVLLHVREIEMRMDSLLHLHESEWRDIQREVVKCYRDGGHLSDNARRYLSLINAMDFAALAARMNVVHGPLLREYLETQIDRRIVSKELLKDIQDCYHASTYRDLRNFIEGRSDQ